MSRSRSLLEKEIIRAAASCFGQQGYRAATLETIAARAGISKVTLYNYVSGKEELLCRVFERTMESYRTGLRQIIDRRLPADDALRRIIRYQVMFLTSDLPFLRVFFSEESGLPPHMAKRVAQEKRECDRAIEKVVREGIREGLFRNLPPTLFVFALLGMCNWLYKWYCPEGKLAPDEIGAIFVDLLERGYVRRGGDKPGDLLLRSLRRVERRIVALDSRLARPPRRGGTRRGPRYRA